MAPLTFPDTTTNVTVDAGDGWEARLVLTTSYSAESRMADNVIGIGVAGAKVTGVLVDPDGREHQLDSEELTGLFPLDGPRWPEPPDPPLAETAERLMALLRDAKYAARIMGKVERIERER